MFSNDLEESKMNRVEIPDFDYDIILEMLRFMYAGRVRQLDTFAAQLLAAADKYQLDKLKALCEECLCANLAVENVCEIIVLSDFHSAESLKQHCIEFINAHAAEVFILTPLFLILILNNNLWVYYPVVLFVANSASILIFYTHP